ncbi:MAG: hypothetical protein CME06_16220 [Gemmatimonadetes bacterium]|nr:hypothetical protein [Gemmatimonadota bacterium]
MSRQSLLDLLTPLERRTLEQEIAAYYSVVAEEEVSESRVQSEDEFAMMRRRSAVRLLNEAALGLICAVAGLFFWAYFSSRFLA